MTIVIVAVSYFMPWWFISADVNSASVSIEGLLRAGLSPLNTNISLIGTSLTIPLLMALNIVGLLSLLLSGIVMVVYSVIPTRPYSKHLLGFAYKKPLILVVLFVISLVAITSLVQAFAGFGIPLSSSGTLSLPTSVSVGNSMDILVSTGFLLPFWLTIVAAGLCIGARIYHKRFTATQVTEAKTAEPAAQKEEPKSPEQKAPTEETKPAEPTTPKEEPQPVQQQPSTEQPKPAETPASEAPAPSPSTNP